MIKYEILTHEDDSILNACMLVLIMCTISILTQGSMYLNNEHHGLLPVPNFPIPLRLKRFLDNLIIKTTVKTFDSKDYF